LLAEGTGAVDAETYFALMIITERIETAEREAEAEGLRRCGKSVAGQSPLPTPILPRHHASERDARSATCG
jgi:hypothetical protein